MINEIIVGQLQQMCNPHEIADGAKAYKIKIRIIFLKNMI